MKLIVSLNWLNFSQRETNLSISHKILMWMYEYMILMMPKNNKTMLLSRLLQQTSIASRLIQGCFNKQALLQDQAFASK